jgi:hypothetical protein
LLETSKLREQILILSITHAVVPSGRERIIAEFVVVMKIIVPLHHKQKRCMNKNQYASQI